MGDAAVEVAAAVETTGEVEAGAAIVPEVADPPILPNPSTEGPSIPTYPQETGKGAVCTSNGVGEVTSAPNQPPVPGKM